MINEMATESWTDKHLVLFYCVDLFLRRYTYHSIDLICGVIYLHSKNQDILDFPQQKSIKNPILIKSFFTSMMKIIMHHIGNYQVRTQSLLRKHLFLYLHFGVERIILPKRVFIEPPK